jgi:hypothetical protein
MNPPSLNSSKSAGNAVNQHNRSLRVGRTPADAETASGDFDAGTLGKIRQALAGLRFGQVVLTLQDGVLVQIERSEKTRLV